MPVMKKALLKETDFMSTCFFFVSWLKIFSGIFHKLWHPTNFGKNHCFWHTWHSHQFQGLSRPKRTETKRNETKRRPRHHQRMTLRGIFRIWILTVRGFFKTKCRKARSDSGLPIPRNGSVKWIRAMQVFLMVNTTNTYLTTGVRMICQAFMRSKICVFFVWGDPLLPLEGWLEKWTLEMSNDQNLKTLATFQYPDWLIGIRDLCTGLW